MFNLFKSYRATSRPRPCPRGRRLTVAATHLTQKRPRLFWDSCVELVDSFPTARTDELSRGGFSLADHQPAAIIGLRQPASSGAVVARKPPARVAGRIAVPASFSSALDSQMAVPEQPAPRLGCDGSEPRGAKGLREPEGRASDAVTVVSAGRVGACGTVTRDARGTHEGWRSRRPAVGPSAHL